MLQHVSEFLSFSRLNNIPLYGLSTLYSSVSGHLVCSHMTVVSDAAVDVGV